MLERKDVEKLADLSVIEVSEEEIEKFRGEIDAILGYVSELQKLAVQDSAQKSGSVVGELYNIMREDTDPHESGLYSKALLEEAPQREGNYVKVKKILNN